MKYKISLIIPVFNAYNTLSKAINSIINQTIGFENIELILVDDKSTDNSRKLINKFAEKYDNIKPIFLKQNFGAPGGPRNIGIENATGDYLMFLDQDDEYLPNSLKILYDTITSKDSDFVISSNFNCYNGNKFLKSSLYSRYKNEKDINPRLNQKSLDLLQCEFVGPWSKIYKRTFITENNIKFLDNHLSEDTYLYVNCLMKANKVTILPNTFTYVYNIYDESTIHNHNLKHFNSFLIGVSKTNDLIKDTTLSFSNTMTLLIESLLLMFSNLDKKNKKEALDKLYDLESNLNCELNIQRKETNLLNNLILKKNYKMAIIISEIYKKLYNNSKIKKIYRKLNVKLLNKE